MNRLRRNRSLGAALMGGAAAALLWLGFSALEVAEGRESQLSVVYTAPGLSVEARGVSVSQVLREIGAKAGFEVVEYGISRTVLNFSIKDAPLEEILRRLLRDENHAIVYRDRGGGIAGGGIATIVLLGHPTSARAIPDSKDRWQVPGRQEDLIRELTRPLDSPGSGPPMAALSGDQGRMGEGGAGQDDTDLRVEEILRGHAMPGLWPLTGAIAPATLPANVRQPVERPALQRPARTAGAGSTRALSPTPVPSDAEETLAITTRLAQQNLKALIDGLATATSSLRHSLASTGR